jgi:uncharacterized protein (DUF302 family)
MNYYYTTILNNITFKDAIQKTTKELEKEGFGILTKVDIKETLKNKLHVNFYNYAILGACNAPYAYEALKHEDKIGTMLPCNVIVQEKEPGIIEISAINPRVSMQAIINKNLVYVAQEIEKKLKKVIDAL